jgi:hypothetical protein
MPFKNFTSGSVLTASDVNTYLAKQAVNQTTSGLPTPSPSAGFTLYETDTHKLKIYTTTATGYVPPWNLPWGLVGSATVTTNITGIGTTTTDLTGLSISAALVKNRQYRINWMAPLLQGATSARAIIFLQVNGIDVANTQTNIAAGERQTPSGIYTFGLGVTSTPSGLPTTTGTYTVKLRGQASAGTFQTDLSTTQPAIFTIEDVGPATTPA